MLKQRLQYQCQYSAGDRNKSQGSSALFKLVYWIIKNYSHLMLVYSRSYSNEAIIASHI